MTLIIKRWLLPCFDKKLAASFLLRLLLCFPWLAQAKTPCAWSEVSVPTELDVRVEMVVSAGMDLTGGEEQSRGRFLMSRDKGFVWALIKDKQKHAYVGDGDTLTYTSGKTVRRQKLADTWIETFSDVLFNQPRFHQNYTVKNQSQNKQLCLSQWQAKESLKGTLPFERLELMWKPGQPPKIQSLVLEEVLGTVYKLGFGSQQWKVNIDWQKLKSHKFILDSLF